MKKLIVLLCSFIFVLSGLAQSLTPNRGVVKDGYNFWFYNPVNGKSATAKPVVIFLHGASLCGNDLNKVKRYGTIDAIEKGRNLDAYVIAPQNPGGSWKPSKINAILEWAEKNYNVDKDRVYVLGMSLGGYGTIDMAAAYPEKIAAAMAFCGGGTTKNFDGLSQVPLWIVHGTADRAVPVSASDKVVAGIRATGDDSRLIYHRVPGMNHSRPSRYFYLKESYEWLFSHSLADRDRRVNKRTFDHSLLASAYKDLGRNRGRSSKISAPTEPNNEPAEDEVVIPEDAADRLMSEALARISNSMERQSSISASKPQTVVSDSHIPAANGSKSADAKKDWANRTSLKKNRRTNS